MDMKKMLGLPDINVEEIEKRALEAQKVQQETLQTLKQINERLGAIAELMAKFYADSGRK